VNNPKTWRILNEQRATGNLSSSQRGAQKLQEFFYLNRKTK